MSNASTTARAVRFDGYGDRDVLYVTDVPMPDPAPDGVVVEVRASSLNPGEARSAPAHWPPCSPRRSRPVRAVTWPAS